MLLLLALLLGSSELVCAQESSSYKIKRLSVTMIADAASSPRFINTATATTMGGASGVCPSGTKATLGFWSLLGAREVPLLLTVNKGPGDPDEVQLSWSGQSSAFTIYRSDSPIAIVAPSNALQTTNICEHTDSTTDTPSPLFYMVKPVDP